MNKDIIQAADRCYTWRHVLAAGDFRGETAQLRANLASALAIQAYADEQGFEVASTDIEGVMEAFRLQHDLISAEDTEKWLTHCGLTLDDFQGFFERRILADRFVQQADDIQREYALAEAAVTECMWPEVVLAGNFEQLAVPLARRVAAQLDGSTPCAPADLQKIRREAKKRLRGCAPDPEWFADLVQMEAIYVAAERQALLPERCAREVRTRALQLTRIELAQVTFPAADQAREAYACAADEGESLDTIAERSGCACDMATQFYADVPEDQRSLFFCAPPGKVFPPVEGEGGFAVCQIRRRIEPDANDAEVLARLQEHLLNTHFDPMVATHVRWLFDPWSWT